MLITHTPANIFSPIGPYAQAIEATSVNRLLFISGTMGLEPDGSLAKTFEAQANRVWTNIDATLAAAGMGRRNLAKLTIWLANCDDWRLGAEIRQRYLGEHKVAMSVVQVGLVNPDWLIEVEAIAVE
jgi:enamine deaminase RidA (YjgF/YER057c/UK114 family)